ncbi:hypothetical protein KIW_00509 [Pediococcus acidilactici MA18/5M]|nr:hypothetical protein KIW_00509 [Pediococcus acidilactici MA18/5M]KZX39385.1 hypothetical protein AV543_06550 [Pediococcus acidilactici]
MGEGDHAHQRLKTEGPNVTTEEGRNRGCGDHHHGPSNDSGHFSLMLWFYHNAGSFRLKIILR